MIIYGNRIIRRYKKISAEACPNCKAENVIELNVFQRYAHVFWIPFFPTQKFGMTLCRNCGQALHPYQLPSSLRESLNAAVKEKGIPIWSFSGIFILIGLFISIDIFDDIHKKEVAQFVFEPKKGDVYTLKLAEDEYTLFKIDSINGDSVYTLMSNYSTDKLTGISKIKSKGSSAYLPDHVVVLKSRLKELLDQEMIEDVER